LKILTFALFLISLGRLFRLSQTRTLKKFFLMSNLAAGIMTFRGSAACLVITPSQLADSNQVLGSTADFLVMILNISVMSSSSLLFFSPYLRTSKKLMPFASSSFSRAFFFCKYVGSPT
jgi:hypothetical protein